MPDAPIRKVFVVGCPRSGTTWVRNMLCAHPLVVTIPNETHVYDELYEPIVEHGLDPTARRRLLDRFDDEPLGQGVGLGLLATRAELETMLVREADSGRPNGEAAENVIAALLDRFAPASGPAEGHVLVEKTPSHLFHSRRILRRFEEARIVEVVRDGRDVCVSMQHRAAEASWVPRDRAEQIRRWVDSLRFAEVAKAEPQAAGRWHTVRFEAAKADPHRAIADLFVACGLPSDDDLVDEAVRETEFARFEGSGEGMLLRRGAVGDWHDDFDEADRELFARLAGDTLTAAGYRL